MAVKFDTWDSVVSALLQEGWARCPGETMVFLRRSAKARIKPVSTGGYRVVYSRQKRR